MNKYGGLNCLCFYYLLIDVLVFFFNLYLLKNCKIYLIMIINKKIILTLFIKFYFNKVKFQFLSG